MHFKLIISLLLVGLTVLFIVQNVAIVEVQFLFWSAQIPRSVLMFIVMAIGVVVGWFLHSYSNYRRSSISKNK